ncbi:major facilitator superfamily domain-containing protein 6-B-like, partial [Diaphorina citri]|uniref:Major facilitator superfamily domain-containing protein 6-B-like n=1 Tax=Diaphorina citri TaxID=121845 RepID=A0A3Q0JMW8_DIACI
MGITITIGGIAGLPLLVMSGPIIEKFGHANVIFIGFLFYAIRLIGYSMITEAWQCLIFEAMESITSSLAFTAAVTYAAKLSTNTTDSSVQGLLGGIYYGVGKGAGSLIGGYLMKGFGTKITYQDPLCPQLLLMPCYPYLCVTGGVTGDRVTLSLAEDHLCMPVTSYNISVPVKLEACGIICDRFQQDFDLDVKSSKKLIEESIAILRARSYAVTEDRGNFYYELAAEDIPKLSTQMGDARNYRFLKNKERFTTSVRNLTKTKYFFPTNGLYNFNCDVKDSVYVCDINEENKYSKSYRFVSRNYSVKLQPVDFIKTGVRQFKILTLSEPNSAKTAFQSVTCIDDL